MKTIRIDNTTIFRILISIAAFLLIGKFIIMVQVQLLWIAAAFFLAVALNPAVSFFARHLPRKSRGAAIMLVLLIFFAILGFLAYSFVPPLVTQTQQLVAAAPDAISKLQDTHGPLGELARKYDISERLASFSGDALGYVTSATGSAVSILQGIFSGLAAIITIFVLTFFMLLESPTWIRNFWALTPKDKLVRNKVLAGQMYKTVTGYVNGNFFTSIIAAASSAVVMTLMDVPYAIPLALLVGILDLVPLVGATLAAVVVVLVALSQSFTAGAVLAVFFAIYQQVENGILQPLIYGKSTELSPLIATIAIILGTTVGGIFGALVAIPVAASIKVLLVHRYGARLDNPDASIKV